MTCTFTNTKQGQVIVKKVMVGGTEALATRARRRGTISSNNGTISAAVVRWPVHVDGGGEGRLGPDALSCDDANSSGRSRTARRRSTSRRARR